MARFFGWGAHNGIVSISSQSVSGIEAYIRWAEYEVPSRLPFYMDQLVQYMALMNQNYARKMAFGPYDPTGMRTELAWRTPDEGIRRITNAYYLGWKVRKVGVGHYRLYNDSREAYFIEFGISEVGWGAGRHVPKGRIRRPVRKLSLLKTMRFMMTTQAFHRIWCDIFRSRGVHAGFTQIVQSPGGGHMRWENVSEHVAASVMRGNLNAGRQMTAGLRTSGGRLQRRVPNAGGGSYTGPNYGRRLP